LGDRHAPFSVIAMRRITQRKYNEISYDILLIYYIGFIKSIAFYAKSGCCRCALPFDGNSNG
jgi:hypothetical protein